VDTLFVDEGGQIALADAIAVGTAARNLVLLGDPNQLSQVSQGSHPPGADASVLQHLLGEDETLRPGVGLFLEETWRMRPEVKAADRNARQLAPEHRDCGERVVRLAFDRRLQPISRRATDAALVEGRHGDTPSEEMLPDRREEDVVVPVGWSRARVHENDCSRRVPRKPE
jgi:hypothetical protein